MVSNQRFEAVTFNYGNLDEWKSYFEEIREVAKSCKVVEEFWNELKRRCDGLTFKDLQEEFDYSTVLLGGVDSSGEYKERSLAKVYAVLFGFKPESIHDLIEKLPTTKIIVEETEFIRFVRNVLNKVSSILSQAESKKLIDSTDVDVEVDYKGILSDYKKLIKILEDFINNVAKILPNYNQKSLFVWILDKLTYRYMTTAYPELRDEQVFGVVGDVLGLDVIFSPDVKDERTKREYEVYSYRGGSVGRELVELFKMIWNYFDSESNRKKLSLIFPEIPNPKNEFLEMVTNALRSIGWKLPDYIVLVGARTKLYDLNVEVKSAKHKIRGTTITDCHILYKNLSTHKVSTRYYSADEKINRSILSFLDDLSPMLFLLHGLKYSMVIDKDTDGQYYIEIRRRGEYW